MSRKTNNSPVITLKIDPATFKALHELVEREGFATVTSAVRALIVGGLDAYPAWGVVRTEMMSAAQDVRAWAINEMLNATKEMMDKMQVTVKNPPDRFVRGKPIFGKDED